MDIQRKAFEAYMADRYKNTVDQRVCINSDGDYMAWDMQVAWNVWQAAKAQVSEGYVVVPMEPTEQILNRMTNAPIEVNHLCDNADIFLSKDEARIAYKAMIEAQEQKG